MIKIIQVVYRVCGWDGEGVRRDEEKRVRVTEMRVDTRADVDVRERIWADEG